MQGSGVQSRWLQEWSQVTIYCLFPFHAAHHFRWRGRPKPSSLGITSSSGPTQSWNSKNKSLYWLFVLLIGKLNMYWIPFWQEPQNQTRRLPQEETMLLIWTTQPFPCPPHLWRPIPLAPSATFWIHLWPSQRKRRRLEKRRVLRIAKNLRLWFAFTWAILLIWSL